MDFRTFSLVLGVRLDKHAGFGTADNPKATLLWKGNEKVRARVSYGHSFSAPPPEKVYSELTDSGRGYCLQGDRNLKPETNDSLQLGLDWEVSRRSLLGVNYFNNDIENLIGTNVLPQPPGLTCFIGVFQYANTSAARTSGFEVELRNALSPDLDFNLGYTFTDSEDEDTGKELTQTPKDKIAVGLNWAFGPYALNLQFGRFGKSFADASNSIEIPEYAAVEMKLAREFKGNRKLFVEVDNLFDEQADYSVVTHGMTSTYELVVPREIRFGASQTF